MPDESCRNCGGCLIEATNCLHCFKSTSMICKTCSTMTSKQFHSLCVPQPTNQTISVPKIMSGICTLTVAMT
ncbi:hypothetical protein OAQ30_01495 [Nitrosopumilus sp.]|nr:hypothetical protein [Nitrosopumilus sp.]